MSVVVFLYSKYSSICMTMLSKMEMAMDFRKICIDHSAIRQLLLKNNAKYNITIVPCILVFFANGVMHKYEGQTCVEWIENTLSQMKHIALEDHQTKMKITEFPSASSPPLRTTLEFKTSDVEVNKTKSSNVFPTSEEGLMNMKRYMDTTPLDVGTATTSQSHDSGDSSTTKEKVSDTDTKEYGMRGIKNDKQESLLSVAQQLQKQREQEEEMRNPNAIQKITNS